jgi:hypothetical protein
MDVRAVCRVHAELLLCGLLIRSKRAATAVLALSAAAWLFRHRIE